MTLFTRSIKMYQPQLIRSMSSIPNQSGNQSGNKRGKIGLFVGGFVIITMSIQMLYIQQKTYDEGVAYGIYK